MYCQLIIIQYAKSLSVGQKSDKIVQLRILKILKRVKKYCKEIQNLRISSIKKKKTTQQKEKYSRRSVVKSL